MVAQTNLLAEYLDLLLHLPEHRVLWVLVHLRLVLNVLRAVSVPQGGHRFIIVVVRRGDGCNHNGLGVAPERIL